ncbi:SRPBCC domain-containing protein, partial [Streptomyces sp. NPDC055092]
SATPVAGAAAGRPRGGPPAAAAATQRRGGGPGGETLEAVLDYRNPYFIGLRTDDAMYRIFGRGRWGAPVGIVVHDFAPDADAAQDETAWRGWLDGVFA